MQQLPSSSQQQQSLPQQPQQSNQLMGSQFGSQQSQQEQMLLKQQQQQMQDMNEMAYNQATGMSNMEMMLQQEQQQQALMNQRAGPYMLSNTPPVSTNMFGSQPTSQMNALGQMQQSNMLNQSSGFGPNWNKSTPQQASQQDSLNMQRQQQQQMQQLKQLPQQPQSGQLGQGSSQFSQFNQSQQQRLNQQQQQQQQQLDQMNKYSTSNNFDAPNSMRSNAELVRSGSLGESSAMYGQMGGEQPSVDSFSMPRSMPLYNMSNQFGSTATSIGLSHSQPVMTTTISSVTSSTVATSQLGRGANLAPTSQATSQSTSLSTGRSQLSVGSLQAKNIQQQFSDSAWSHATELSPILDVSPSIEAAEAEIIDRRRMVRDY